MGQLDDKTALVTGASTGIGLAIARRFAAEGATVYLTGRRKAELDAAVEQVNSHATGTGSGGSAIGVQSDVSRLDDLDRLFAEITERSGRLDIVVANAGVGDFGPLGEITEEEYDRTTSINFKGTVFTVQKALPLLSAGASVILLSSSSALRSVPGLGVYAATKAAIRSLARTWAAELIDRGIRVNALTPGPVATPGADELLAALPHGDQPAVTTPLGRVGRPEEVAATALYLAGDQSSFTTGAELLVDGGATQL
ncbi:SDR family NAD(P)-dependent oxidoreductase [Kitasatospora kifunensis]|uniref:NAD(P)-dependent dehydrogenase (Short-subunit alcohol dehydrogenase family) n=1 Tax=Kitasatospora kifunensis TaxID=58351 RepID=A0A7W7VXT4_KITKI|nr:glucose 1-dehydrogenase [Kitasatospora kifunensis]MBB4926308.1 NAD(P)-dependent dehydrogenase (short-subunit alcohol dehydrogenase family) [Kitasatospora kifunensis]